MISSQAQPTSLEAGCSRRGVICKFNIYRQSHVTIALCILIHSVSADAAFGSVTKTFALAGRMLSATWGVPPDLPVASFRKYTGDVSAIRSLKVAAPSLDSDAEQSLLDGAIAGTLAPQIVYSNTIAPATGFYEPGNAAAGFWMADDISTVSVGGCSLASYEIVTYALAGTGAYEVTIGLWDGYPCDLASNSIAGSAIAIAGVPDGEAFTLAANFPSLPSIPQNMFMLVEFSKDGAGWVIAEIPEIGFSEDAYVATTDTTLNGVADVCGPFFLGGPPTYPQASFWAEIVCGTRCTSDTDCDDGDPLTVSPCIEGACRPAFVCPDLDPSSSIDLRDFARFQVQFSGQAEFFCPEIRSADLDDNGTVDLADFAAFQSQLGGESVCTCPPAGCSPRCGDGCCNGDETACSCPEDGCEAVCGDGCCTGRETVRNCPQDNCQS